MLYEYRYFVFLGIVLISFMIRSLFSKIIIKTLLRLTRRTKTNLDEEFVKALTEPLKAFIIILGFYWGSDFLDLSPEHSFLLLKIFRALIIILLAWGLTRFSDTFSSLILNAMSRNKIQVEGIFIPFISKGIKIVIIALAISVVAGEWGYDINGFIAGLGIGGLAFALAAKDTIANIFGGLVLTLDRPFTIGDWISTPNLEGTVEEISFRSTKVRTFAHSLVYVPNSTLANQPITNWSKMGKRRITFNLGVEYSTPIEKIKLCVEQIKKMLMEHQEIDKQTIFVNFDKFNDSSLDIFIYCFTITTNWGEFLSVKEDVNLKIMEILQANEVNVAFPSRTLYMQLPLPENNRLPDLSKRE